MKATELLKQQHREVSRLFQAIEDTEDVAEKKSYFLQLASNLVAHDGIERKIFYPACEAKVSVKRRPRRGGNRPLRAAANGHGFKTTLMQPSSLSRKVL